MSEEVALADANLREIARLRTAVQNAQALASEWELVANTQRTQLDALAGACTQAQADNAALCAALADAVTCCQGIHYVDIDGEAEAEACDLWITLDDRARATHAGEHPGAALLAELAAQRAQLDVAQARVAALQAEQAALRRWLRLAVAAWRAERASGRALASALRGLLAEPYGCPMCDAGTLRNPEKAHWPECPYAVARAVLGE